MVLEYDGDVFSVVGKPHYTQYHFGHQPEIIIGEQHTKTTHGIHHAMNLCQSCCQSTPQNVFDAYMMDDVGPVILVKAIEKEEGAQLFEHVVSRGIDGHVDHGEPERLYFLTSASILTDDMHIVSLLTCSDGNVFTM